jgi:hypothetical protein
MCRGVIYNFNNGKKKIIVKYAIKNVMQYLVVCTLVSENGSNFLIWQFLLFMFSTETSYRINELNVTEIIERN